MGSVGVVTLARAGMAAPQRKARLVRDVERGLIECAITHRKALPGSLSGFRQPGIAEVDGGIMKFQPVYDLRRSILLRTFLGITRMSSVRSTSIVSHEIHAHASTVHMGCSHRPRETLVSAGCTRTGRRAKVVGLESGEDTGED